MANSRTKGMTFENEICRWVRESFGVSVRRNLDQYQIADQGDIVVKPFLIECKRYAVGTWHQENWWTQVLQASKSSGLIPVLIYRYDRQKAKAVFRASDIADYPESDAETVTVDLEVAEMFMREKMVSDDE